MASLEPPPGYNDYLFHLGILRNLFYPKPRLDFRSRMWVLGSLLLFNVLAVVPALAFLWLVTRKTREAFWLFKWVHLRRGKLLVLNSTIMALFWTIPTGLLFTLYIYYNDSVFNNHVDQKWTAAWRATVWTPMLFQSWLQAWALLQAYVVLADTGATGSHFITHFPRTVNVLFFASTIFVFLPLVVMQILTSHKWTIVWAHYMTLQDLLEAGAPFWTLETPDNLTVHADLRFLVDLAASHGQAEVGIKSICTIIRSIAFLVNILSISLFLTLRRQVKSQKTDLDERSAVSRQELSRISPPTPKLPFSHLPETPTTIPSLTPPRDEAMISNVDRERSAEERRADFSAPAMERIQNLEDASARVSTIGVSVFISSLASCCVFGWTVSVPSFSFIAAKPWTIIEVSLFLNIWIWALFQPPITYKLGEHAFKGYKKRVKSEKYASASSPGNPRYNQRREPPETTATPEVRVILEKNNMAKT